MYLELMIANLAMYLPQIEEVIKKYGVTVQILRDEYVNEVGVKTLKSTGNKVSDVYMVLDNSEKQVKATDSTILGVQIPKVVATMYYAYEPNLQLQHGDYFIYEGYKYTLDIPVNLVNANLVYQVLVRGEIQHAGFL